MARCEGVYMIAKFNGAGYADVKLGGKCPKCGAFFEYVDLDHTGRFLKVPVHDKPEKAMCLHPNYVWYPCAAEEARQAITKKDTR